VLGRNVDFAVSHYSGEKKVLISKIFLHLSNEACLQTDAIGGNSFLRLLLLRFLILLL
jgi:hypothetical protein